MADFPGRKTFKVFGQEFIVDERYTVTKELGQGAYGVVWYEQFSSFVGRGYTTYTLFETTPYSMVADV